MHPSPFLEAYFFCTKSKVRVLPLPGCDQKAWRALQVNKVEWIVAELGAYAHSIIVVAL